MMRTSIFLFTLLLLTSCASHIQLLSKGCPTTGSWNSFSRNPDFLIEEKVWSAMDKKNVFLAEVLKQNNIDCTKIEQLNVRFISTPGDVLASFLPYFSRSTIQIRGIYDEPVEEDE